MLINATIVGRSIFTLFNIYVILQIIDNIMNLSRYGSKIWWVAVLIFISNQSTRGSNEVSLPPSITRQHPKDLEVYREGQIVLTCAATGYPQPVYEWIKNGEKLEFTQNMQLLDGSLEIKEVTSSDEGYYQCRASNEYGVAVSKMISVRTATVGSAISDTEIETFSVKIGEPFTLRCGQIEDHFPKSTIRWDIVKTPSDYNMSPRRIEDNRRIHASNDGSLYFANVEQSDTVSDVVYRCMTHNPILDVSVVRGYFKLNARSASEQPANRDPAILVVSSSPVIALEGQDMILECFFSGLPTPHAFLDKGSLRSPEIDRRLEVINSGTVRIRDVRQSDGGQYQCIAMGYRKSVPIEVQVQAIPRFNYWKDKPYGQNITDGKSAIFKCEAYGKPAAEITWLRNGVKLDPDNLPKKYRLLRDNKYLRIDNVCKTCPDGSSDLAVIQCNASNVHDYAWGEGYLNVLKKTEIVERPEDVYLSADDSSLSVTFNCRATSDDSTPVDIDWYRVNNENSPEEAENQHLKNDSDVVTIASDGSSLTLSLDLILNVDDKELRKYEGEYKCVASNGYSSDEAVASVIIANEIKSSDAKKTSGTKYKPKDGSKSNCACSQ